MTEITKRSITSTVLGIFVWISLEYLDPIVFFLFLAAASIHIMFLEWPKFFSLQKLPFWLITPFYPILPLALLFALILSPNISYHHLLFYLFVLVSSHDTGSFMMGTAYGKHKIAPAISPAKTWEGFFGGCLLAMLSTIILVLWRGGAKGSWPALIGITLFTSVLALMGDLFESWLKRRAHLKDSGTILPGHGGFLDRFDGVMFTAVIFYIFRDTLCVMLGA
jgi:phosphatidate cytidylyltransferase